MRRGTPKIRLTRCEAAVGAARARMPFRYGSACLTAVPLLTVRVHLEGSGRKGAWGFASDCLPPRWFDKDPSRSYREEVESLLASFRIAREVYLRGGATPATASDLWLQAFPRVVEEGARAGLNALECSFGSSLLERAVVDAVTRLRGVSFFEALSRDILGMRTSEDLPPAPVQEFVCRHTVGLGDPILVGEIPEGERTGEGLPRALEEAVETYGLFYFKVKLRGDRDADLDRLGRLAVLLGQRCRGGYRVTLDGNEQYRDLTALEGLVDALRSKPYGEAFVDSILYIEQPAPRDLALDPSLADGIARLSLLKPVIIDESDDLPDAFERAARMGYSGVAHKNCKGIFKALRNRSMVRSLNAEAGKEVYFQTGEDLATLPVLSLQQDLAMLAALDVRHVERNGHHYFRGLDHLPREEAAGAARAHPDLYEDRGESAFLRIQEGRIRAESIQAPGFGYACEIAFEARTPLEAWTFDRLGLP